MSWHEFPRYVSVAERRQKAKRKLAELRKTGHNIKPIEIADRRIIAYTFWGNAWCENLEIYSDYDNRLSRGRSYARSGSILDLQITQGQIEAKVSGSRLYKVTLHIAQLPAEQWQALRTECAGQINSLVELLQGKLSSGVMEVVTREGVGLFPSLREIKLRCTCPDFAEMCKHVAATLYGVGARLDHEPEMLFLLRGVDPAEMIEEAISRGVTQHKQRRRQVLNIDDLSTVFGVDIDFSEEALTPLPKPRRSRHKTKEKNTRRGSTTATRSRRDFNAIGATVNLTKNADQILTVIIETPGLRSPEIAQLLSIPRTTVLSSIAKLKQHDLIKFVGAPKNGGYYPDTTSHSSS